MNEYFYITIAGFHIQFTFNRRIEADPVEKYARSTFQKEVTAYLKNFETTAPSKKPDFSVIVEDRFPLEIMTNKKGSYFARIFRKRGNTITTYANISMFQFQNMLYKIISELLNSHHGLLLHSSSILLNGRAHLFVGLPGQGKSTLINVLSQQIIPLSDDTSLLRPTQTGTYDYFQVPFIENTWWIQKEKDRQLPIGSIYFIHKSKSVRLIKISDKKQILPRLLPHNLTKTKKPLVDFISSTSNFYELYENLNTDEIYRALISTDG